MELKVSFMLYLFNLHHFFLEIWKHIKCQGQAQSQCCCGYAVLAVKKLKLCSKVLSYRLQTASGAVAYRQWHITGGWWHTIHTVTNLCDGTLVVVTCIFVTTYITRCLADVVFMCVLVDYLCASCMKERQRESETGEQSKATDLIWLLWSCD